MKKAIQLFINFFPTKKIPTNKLIKFFFKFFYFLIRKVFKGPFVIETSFFKVLAYTGKNESSSIYFRGFHDYNYLLFINRLYHQNDKSLFIDVGANIGNNTLSFAKKYTNSYCYSFEPHPKYYNQLKENIELNKLKNVEFYNLCLSNCSEDTYFYLDKNNPGGSRMLKNPLSFHKKINLNNYEEIRMKTEALDVFLKSIKISDYNNFFLKIDVEGNEKKVLQGSEKFILSYFPDILLEIEEKNFDKDQDIRKTLFWLESIGYNFFLNLKKTKINLNEIISINEEKFKNKIHFHEDLFISKKKTINV